MEPKIAVESKEPTSFWEENAVNNPTKSSEKSKQGKVHNAKKGIGSSPFPFETESVHFMARSDLK